jgi:uncharacterized membrane protein YfbV (UPF0208 family)
VPNANGLHGWFQRWLSTLPSTNYLIFIGSVLSVVTVLALLTCLVLGIQLQEAVVNAVLLFDTGLVTGGVVQFGVKRATTDVAVMNAQAAIDQNQALRTTTTETTTEKTETETVPGGPGAAG